MPNFNAAQRGALVRPTKKKYLLNPFQSVAVSSTAWLQCPIGLRYHAILIPFSGTTMTVAHMSAVRFYINNEPAWNLSGTDIDLINQFDGLPSAATYGGLYLNFERLGLIDHMKRYDTAINTGVKCRQAPHGITSMRIEIDIDATAVAPVVGPAVATVSTINPDQGNYILRRKKIFENMQVVSPNEYLFATTYNGNKNAPYLSRLYIGETAANLNNLRLSTNGTDDVNITSAMNNMNIASYGIRKVNTGVFIYDTAEDGNYNNFFRIGNAKTFDIRIKDSNVNAQLPVITETLGSVAAA
jgi:hypothetical protein